MRKVPFVEGEYYHIYNRGVDKRTVFGDQKDADRFFKSVIEFNSEDPIGSIYENSFIKNELGHPMSKSNKKLVNIVAYCLNPNHYHFILEQVIPHGIEKFMQRLGNGYTKYFNNKNHRSGSLFQGKFKSSHVDSNEYLLHLSAYVNLNFKVHKTPENFSIKLVNSWSEYLNEVENGLCSKGIILNQFKNSKEYESFALSSLEDILERKEREKELKEFLLE